MDLVLGFLGGVVRPVRGWLEPTRRGLIPSCFGA
jgi:hypothetical protein